MLGETLKRLSPLLNLGLQSSDISVLRSDAELFDSEGCEPRLANSLRLLFSLSGPDDSGTCLSLTPAALYTFVRKPRSSGAAAAGSSAERKSKPVLKDSTLEGFSGIEAGTSALLEPSPSERAIVPSTPSARGSSGCSVRRTSGVLRLGREISEDRLALSLPGTSSCPSPPLAGPTASGMFRDRRKLSPDEDVGNVEVRGEGSVDGSEVWPDEDCETSPPHRGSASAGGRPRLTSELLEKSAGGASVGAPPAAFAP